MPAERRSRDCDAAAPGDALPHGNQEGARRQAYELYANELEGQLQRCLERVAHAKSAHLTQNSPQGAANSLCAAAASRL
jgi:hypothetical protein